MISGRAKKTKHPGADRRWTLLFIGDHGRVITLKRFKAVVITAALMLFSAIIAAAILFFVNIDTLVKNKELQRYLEKSETQIETLRREKETLLARLVIAESKAKKNSVEQQQRQAAIEPANPISSKPQPDLKKAAEKVDPKTPPVPEAAQPKPLAAQKVEPEPVLSVAVENFSVAYEPDSQNLIAQFRIKNTGPESQPVSGQTVVVLKGDDLPIDEWLVMPAMAMIGDMPSGKKGKSFSIQRYRTIKFTFETPDNFDAFQTAVVYVFLKSGELILEEDFPVTLPPPAEPEPEAPSSQAPSSEELPAKTPSAETPPDDGSPIQMFF